MAVRTWWDDALCKGTDIAIWYPTGIAGEGHLAVPAITAEYCAACPVFADCRSWALRHEQYGVWAATSMRQRNRMRSQLGIELVTPGIQLRSIADPTDGELAAIEAEAERTSA